MFRDLDGTLTEILLVLSVLVVLGSRRQVVSHCEVLLKQLFFGAVFLLKKRPFQFNDEFHTKMDGLHCCSHKYDCGSTCSDVPCDNRHVFIHKR